jgi:type I restriction enzyme S subunit
MSRKFLESKIRTTAGQAGVSGGDIKRTPIPLPPLGEQEVVIAEVEAQLSIIDHLKADLESKLRNSKGLRQAILRDAFAGHLEAQDENDEPASELLKRIATQRERRTGRSTPAWKGPAEKPLKQIAVLSRKDR